MLKKCVFLLFAISAVLGSSSDPLSSDPDSLLGTSASIEVTNAPAPVAHGVTAVDPHAATAADPHASVAVTVDPKEAAKIAGAAAVSSTAAPEVIPAAKEALAPAVAEAFSPLHCFTNPDVKDHVYTLNPVEFSSSKGVWKSCGIAAEVLGKEVEGFTKLFRYMDLHTLKHQYSSHELLTTDTLKSEGWEGYVSAEPREGLVALKSLFNSHTGERILSALDSHDADFTVEETLGYVKAPTESELKPETVEEAKESTETATRFWADHPADSRLQPVFRYWNPALQDHFYTMNYNLLEAGKNGWRYQGIQCYIYPTKIEDTVPMYRYWNLRLGDHFYTTDFYDMGEGKDGYRFKGILGYVRDAPSKDTVPLYRYFNKQIGDHFYTTNTMSQAQGHDEWAAEGIAAYVYPVPNPSEGKDANEYALLVPLYRYWNKRFADHFYTTIWKEVDTGTHGWEYQGVQALVYPKQEPGTVPLYRYWNIRTLDHFYTTNFEALGQGGKDGWKYEGVECYVDIYRKPGTVPLYRYFNNKLNDHFYTTKWLAREFKGWVYEGIQCYVHRKPLDSSDQGRVKATVPGTAALYRYWSASAKDHMYTANWDELGAGAQGYVLEGVAGFVWRDASAGGIALHRYYNPRVLDHFYTTDFKILKSGGKDGWEYEGVTGYVQAAARPGTVKLNRYFSKTLQDHLYTADDLGANVNSYVFQGIAGYILPYKEQLSLGAAGVASSELQENTVELHAYYNPTTKDHFYTTNFEVLGAGKGGWEYNGVIGRILSTEQANTRKLRQYFSKSRKDHRYTIRHIRGGDWQFEGTVGYVFETQVPGTTTLMNFENKKAMDNALALDQNGPSHGGPFEYVETLGYIIPAKKH
jgi:hypothetical protein